MSASINVLVLHTGGQGSCHVGANTVRWGSRGQSRNDSPTAISAMHLEAGSGGVEPPSRGAGGEILGDVRPSEGEGVDE
eukprot:6238257-Prorocentrum_lima.AAC.1